MDEGGWTRGWIGGIGLGGRTEGSDWGLPSSKENKTFFFRNYTKILLNLVNFSPLLQSPLGDINTSMAFRTKRKVWTGGNIGGNGVGLGRTGSD